MTGTIVLIYAFLCVAFVVLAVLLFAAWICDHPTHTVCKRLPPRTEPCKHERFVMDNQIRAIKCKQCGMRAWVEKDHVDLFPPKKQIL
jgi:hypothetical protein